MGEDLSYELLESLYGYENLEFEELKDRIKTDSVNLLSQLETIEFVDGNKKEIVNIVNNYYNSCSKRIIDELSNFYFHMPIEMAIATKEQEKIQCVFLDAAERLGFDRGVQCRINIYLDVISNKINKRFSFDEAALIHLIEASKGSNIQLEEDIQRRFSRNVRQILRQRDDGTYYLAEVTHNRGIDTYTSGKSIPKETVYSYYGRPIHKTTVDNLSNIELSSYPGAKDLINQVSTDELLKQVMKNLFDNLELCVDTYKFFYSKDNSKPLDRSVSVLNTAVMADDQAFDFYYDINRWNLPHLLGIQRGDILSNATIKYFAEVGHNGSIVFPINKNSSAFAILKALLKNKDRIIADRGLVEDNGKIYQLFPWEKIILKTSSFMRGDFFKTCFCLVKLDSGLNATNEKFVSISSTKYDDSIVSNKFDARLVLRDLIRTAKQRKDFIFRTFVENYDSKGAFLGYVPQSINTGKSESIVTRNGEHIHTLDRFRRVLQSSGVDGGTVIQSIENDNMGKRVFSPIEQALTHISVGTTFGLDIEIPPVVAAFEQGLKEDLEQDFNRSFEHFSRPGRSK